MSAVVLELDSRPDHQILDRARNEHFVRAGLCHNPRANMDRDTFDRIPNEFTLARMQSSPDLQAESSNSLTHRERTTNRPSCSWRPTEGSEYSVPSSSYLCSPGSAKLFAECGVIVAQHLAPATVAQQCGFLGRANNIDKQHSGKNAPGFDATLRRPALDAYCCQQLFVSVAASTRDRSCHISARPLLRATGNGLLPRPTRPVNPSAGAGSPYFDGTPFQQYRRTGSTDRPCFGRIPAHIQMMDADAEEFRYKRLVWNVAKAGLNDLPL